MGRRQQRFEPEIYLQKAEDDIRGVQTLCSLAEPSWDGYCGLVLLNEDESAQSINAADEEEAEAHEELGRSDEPHDFQDQMERQHWQDEILQTISGKIKDISNVPKPQREKLLASLAEEAQRAAEHCKTKAKSQLLSLAEFARSARAEQHAEAGHSKLGGADTGRQEEWSSEQIVPKSDASKKAMSEQGKGRRADGTASAANDLFKTAIDLLKRDELPEAEQTLKAALELCPQEEVAARNKIKKYASIVKAELRRRDSTKGPSNDT